jgi:hypothetical protein
MKNTKSQINLLLTLWLLAVFFPAFAQEKIQLTLPEKDERGKKYVIGPVPGGVYENVHIVSDSVGINGYPITLKNSIVDARICIKSTGRNTLLVGNELNCDLAIEFTGNILMNNTFINNRYRGQFTNRPDVFR